MKKLMFLLPLIALALLMSCTPAVGPSSSQKLILTSIKTLSGIQIVASKSSKGLARADNPVTFGSTDPSVVIIPVLPPDLTGKVAVVDSSTGLVTPLGSTPATFTVTATDGTASGEVEITTSVIDLAGATGHTHWVATATDPPVFMQSVGSSVFIDFYGNVSDAELDHTAHSATFKNQLNAGYFTLPNMPAGMKLSWSVINGNLTMPEVHLKRADTSSPWVEDLTAISPITNQTCTDGNLGAYDQTTLNMIEASAGSGLTASVHNIVGTTYSITNNTMTLTMQNPLGFGGVKDSNGNLYTTLVVTFAPSN